MKKEKKITGVARIVCIVFAILALGASVLFGCISFGVTQSLQEDYIEAFYSLEETEEIRCAEFIFISEEFASYENDESQKFYFVLDKNMVPFIIYINAEDFSKYEANYNYTFDDTGEVPKPENAYALGIPMKIDDELKALGIEYFNDFWGEDILTEENFEEYVGTMYLDATLVGDATEVLTLFYSSCAIGALVIGIILIVLLCLNKKTKKEQVGITESM